MKFISYKEILQHKLFWFALITDLIKTKKIQRSDNLKSLIHAW